MPTPTMDERLTSLEARGDPMADMRSVLVDLRGDTTGRLTELRADMNLRFAQVNGRFSELRDDLNLRAHDAGVRFTEVNGQFSDVHRRMAELAQQLDRQFAWLIATDVAVLLAVVGALVSALYH
jgi:hypothetical protein